MKTGVRLIALALVASLLAGPLAPYASAQQPAQQPPPAQEQKEQPPAQEQKEPPPAQQQQPVMMQEQMKKSDDTVYEVEAGVFNAFYVPGKVVTCTAGGIVAVAVLLVTFGTAYKAAAGTINEGCGGRWTLTADDVRPDPDTYSRSR